MSEEQNNQEAQQEQKPATPPAEAQKTENPSQEQTVPYARFKEVNDKLKALEDAAAKAATEQQKAEEKRMEEQQQWQKLAEERGKQMESLKEKVADYEKLVPIISKQVQDEINGWPEKVKNLFPTDEMSVVEMMEWANRFRPLAQEMAGTPAPVGGNGRGPRPSGSAADKQVEMQQQTWGKQAARRYR